MKSSLWNIGETMLADMAYKLEKGGREHDIDMLKVYTPDFLNEMRALLKKLKSKVDDDGNQEFPDTDIEALCSRLLTIKEMCADYNRKGALDMLAGIKHCSKKTRTVLDQIMELVLHSDFEEAETAVAAYTDSLFPEALPEAIKQ